MVIKKLPRLCSCMKKAYSKADVASAVEKAVEKALAKMNAKSTTVAETEKPKAVQGQPIEVYPNANLGLTRVESDKADNGFIRDSIQICPNSENGLQIFASSFVNKGGSGYRGKLSAYIADKKAFCKAIMEAKHIPRTDV